MGSHYFTETHCVLIKICMNIKHDDLLTLLFVSNTETHFTEINFTMKEKP